MHEVKISLFQRVELGLKDRGILATLPYFLSFTTKLYITLKFRTCFFRGKKSLSQRISS